MRLKLTLLAALLGLTAADTSTHTYANGEHVELWVNKVGGIVEIVQIYVESVPRSTWSLQSHGLCLEATPLTIGAGKRVANVIVIAPSYRQSSTFIVYGIPLLISMAPQWMVVSMVFLEFIGLSWLEHRPR